jgi:hypothetical protein
LDLILFLPLSVLRFRFGFHDNGGLVRWRHRNGVWALGFDLDFGVYDWERERCSLLMIPRAGLFLYCLKLFGRAGGWGGYTIVYTRGFMLVLEEETSDSFIARRLGVAQMGWD